MNDIITFKILERYNIVHFFSCKPFNYLDKNIKDYFKIPDDIKIIGCNQTHSNRVVKIDKNNINDTFENTDGLITNLDNVALITKVADCQSILLYDYNKGVIGNIHSGWKGTLNKIIDNALDIFINDYNCNPQDIIACINPSLLTCCSEFSLIEYDLFKKEFSEFLKTKNNNKCVIDLVGINKYLMINKGLKEENIYISEKCTSCNNKIFHSYRKDNHTKNRNISIIYKKHDTIF